LLERQKNLKDLQIEILGKFYTALELIPLPVLEQFPKFDLDSFKKLQDLHRHVKAKLRLVQTKLRKEDEINVSQSSETSESALFRSCGTPTSDVFESHLINNNKDLNVPSTSISKRIDFHQGSPNIMESHAKKSNNMESLLVNKLSKIIVPNKKSTFQLKRPIKTILGTEISKTIAEMWEKDQQMSKIANSTMDSDYEFKSVKDTFNDNVKTPPENEKDVSMQKNNIKDNLDNSINNNKSQGRIINKISIFFIFKIFNKTVF
jgi:bloom syndrome protein